VAVVADLAKLSVGREDYYVREVAENREEYLSGHGESPGRWCGAGAAALGQEGVASTEGFKRIFQGRHPDTGELLGRPHGKGAVPSWDLVLRPVKDVGVLYALGDERVNRAVMSAHHEGVAAAVAYLDAHVGTRRGHGGREKVSGRGLVVVGFDHRTSREGDPLPHTHLIIANRVQGPDGRWTTLDGRDLYAHRRAADALYRAAYQRSLTRSLGIAWGEADRWGNRPIIGMPAEVVRAFSKRNQQITAHLAQLEEQGRQRTPALVRFAVHATRQAKRHEAPETLYERWRAEALTRGIDPERLVRQVSGRAREQDQRVSNLAVKRAFGRLAGPEGLTTGASTFARQDVLVALGGELTGAGPTDLGVLTERFLAERAVAVIDDRAEAGTERRWSTPDLLSVERALVECAEARQGERAGVVAAEAVRATLAAHPTIGEDQAGMVRDLCQRGDGVAVVEGRAGTGKTFALGVARHVWQVGYRVLGAAPTGIATMSLEAEGFEDTATVDRLLVELDRYGAREVLGDRAVLVVDEAGMVGSRKLARLLDHAQRAGAKVVLVGDDRQLAAIDAGGGFRALRLRLGASELVENRRQLQAWERDALELVREGLVEEAVAAYREHDRLVAVETKFELTLALVKDWWRVQQDADGDPAKEAVILAWQCGEVDRLNTICQQIMADHGRLGVERLRVGDRQLAVGDRVVCGRNALARLGVANGTRGTITALDLQQRTLTLRVDGEQAREVTLPAWYLDGQPRWGWQQDDTRRTVDLAYATTGHKAQGLTRWRALVRLTGREDSNWLYVQLSRAKQATTIYTQVGPELAASEVDDLPEVELPDGYQQLAQTIGRDGGQQLALDTTARLDLRRLSTRELRAERDRLARLLAQAPKDQARRLAQATRRCQDAEGVLAIATTRRQAAAARVAELGRLGGLGHRRELAEARQQHRLAQTSEQLARRQADRAGTAELAARRAQQQRAGWLERHPHIARQWREVTGELAWQQRARQAGVEAERPAWQERILGPLPGSVHGRRAWRQAAAQLVAYRDRYGIRDPEQALGPEPKGGDLEQRRAWRACRTAAERVRAGAEPARLPDREQPTRTAPSSLPQRGAERAAG
jgi:conjugative relaxase-like TrwC/TraI family protein